MNARAAHLEWCEYMTELVLHVHTKPDPRGSACYRYRVVGAPESLGVWVLLLSYIGSMIAAQKVGKPMAELRLSSHHCRFGLWKSSRSYCANP